jgi:transcriptional regulator GlxA family with amidase domain
VKERYSTLQYLITVCTGAGIAARAGVLDGKHATTNKRAWAETTALGPKVKWVAQARWVTDGNIWTSSGVAAGTDAMIAFIEAIYSNATATTVANGMEYVYVFYHPPICGLVKGGNTDFWSPRYEKNSTNLS